MFRSRIVWRCWFVMLLVLTARVGHAEETLAERRERVAKMPAEEKEALLQKSERFTSLPDAEKARLRTLHTDISSAQDGERLTHVLERYHAWLATLSSAERSALLSLPTEQRLAKVKELVRNQEEKQFRELVKQNLQPEDRKAIITFLDGFADKHKEAILTSIPREFRPKELDGRSRWPVLMHVLRLWSENNAEMPKPTPEEVDALVITLSPKARQSLETIRDPVARTKLAQDWIRAAIMSRGMPTLPPVSPEELRRFSVEELTAQERERLESLPAEEMPVALQRAYYEHRWRRNGWTRGGPGGGGRGPGEFGPGGPDGPPPMDDGGRRGGKGRDERGPDGKRDDRKGPRYESKGPLPEERKKRDD